MADLNGAWIFNAHIYLRVCRKVIFLGLMRRSRWIFHLLNSGDQTAQWPNWPNWPKFIVIPRCVTACLLYDPIQNFCRGRFLISLLDFRSPYLEVDLLWPSNFFAPDLDETWYMDSTQWDLHEYVICFQIRGQGQGHRPQKGQNLVIFKIYLLRQCELNLRICCI